MKNNALTIAQTISPVSDSTVTPRTFSKTREQLIEIADQAIQTSPVKELSENLVQTLCSNLEKGIQTMPNSDLMVQGNIQEILRLIETPVMYHIDGYMLGSELLLNNLLIT